MAEEPQDPKPQADEVVLEGGTYEIIRSRLDAQANDLRERLAKLNQARQDVFGAIPTTLIATERITTRNNCVPREMVSIGKNRFLFGYNVHIGLKTETALEDVFDAYEYKENTFHSIPPDMLEDAHFKAREAIIKTQHPQFGELYMQNVAPKLSATPGGVRTPGPELGQHNVDIYKRLLNFSDERIAELLSTGII